MEKIIVRATFDAAHRQIGYSGDCRFVHGHTWRGVIVVSAEAFPRDDMGMSIDFRALKAILRQFDHKLITTKDDPTVGDLDGVIIIRGTGGPSVENVAVHVMDEVETLIRATFGRRLHTYEPYHVKVMIAETANNRFVVTRQVVA